MLLVYSALGIAMRPKLFLTHPGELTPPRSTPVSKFPAHVVNVPLSCIRINEIFFAEA